MIKREKINLYEGFNPTKILGALLVLVWINVYKQMLLPMLGRDFHYVTLAESWIEAKRRVGYDEK